jgi:DNA-directed RNA polymerase subunit E'
MFYKTELKAHVRVEPQLLGEDIEVAITKQLKKQFEGYISKDVGSVIDIASLTEIGQGVLIPGDGGPYYETTFEILTFKPEVNEVILGKVKDITEFGVFLNMGPMEGMVHVSQTMDDFVSFSKEKTLAGRDSKRVLKVGDECIARIIAVSFKDVSNPKIGVTMRQPGLGKMEWLEEDKNKSATPVKEVNKGKKTK